MPTAQSIVTCFAGDELDGFAAGEYVIARRRRHRTR